MAPVSVRAALLARDPTADLASGISKTLLHPVYRSTGDDTPDPGDDTTYNAGLRNNYPYSRYDHRVLNSLMERSQGHEYAFTSGSAVGVRATIEAWRGALVKETSGSWSAGSARLYGTTQYPDEEKSPDYHREPNGIAANFGLMQSWYITDNAQWPASRPIVHALSLWKDLKSDSTEKLGLPDSLRNQGYDHLGDCSYDHRTATLWIALEGGTGGAPENAVWAVGDNGPAYRRPAGYGRFVSIGSFGLPEADEASWVAINPLNNLLYSSDFDDPKVTLRVYQLAQDASARDLDLLGELSLFGPDGQPFGGRRIQGGCFAPNGHLFLVSDSSSGGGIYGFDVATGRQFLYHHVTNPGESEEGDTKLGSRNAFEFQGLGFQYLTSAQSSQTYGSLHLLVMERRVWSKNRVTVNHYAIDYS